MAISLLAVTTFPTKMTVSVQNFSIEDILYRNSRVGILQLLFYLEKVMVHFLGMFELMGNEDKLRY